MIDRLIFELGRWNMMNFLNYLIHHTTGDDMHDIIMRIRDCLCDSFVNQVQLSEV